MENILRRNMLYGSAIGVNQVLYVERLRIMKNQIIRKWYMARLCTFELYKRDELQVDKLNIFRTGNL